MIRYELVVEPHGSLYVGGYTHATGGSDGDTARDAGGLLIPGSTVKGALREAAQRLVAGAGRGEELLERLFGTDERAEKRQEGRVRVGPLRPGRAGGEAADVDAGELVAVRHHVSLDRASRQAAPGRLFENQVTAAGHGLQFRGELTVWGELSADERGLLASAAAITDQIGGGRGRGLGHVCVTLTPADAAEAEAPQAPADATAALLVFEAEEPLHLAAVKDPGNFTVSKDHIDGSTLRGAVAATLGRTAGTAELETVVAGEAAAVFGDARAGDPGAIPAPLTLSEPKRGGAPADVALDLCAEALGGALHGRPADSRTARGTFAPSEDGWRRVDLQRRTITRAARDHASGRGAAGLLYSLEVLEPWKGQGSADAGERLRFYAPVSGSSEQLALAIRAAHEGLIVGGDRNRGFGRLRLASVDVAAPLAPLPERHHRWAEALGRLGIDRPESTGALLAVGPLALDQARLVDALAEHGLELVGGVTRRRAHGGWNSRMGLPRTVAGHFVPGSVLLVATGDRRSPALPGLTAVERDGVGPGRPDGWGRLVACHPIHVDCSVDRAKEERS